MSSVKSEAQVLFNEPFTTATGTTPPSGWSNIDNTTSGDIWAFSNPGGRTFPSGSPGFSGNFAILDSDNYGSAGTQDANLESPVFDASLPGTYQLEWDEAWEECCGAIGTVQVWNGTTWTTVLTQPNLGLADGLEGVPQHMTLNIGTATGGSANAKVRFTYAGSWDYWWAIDNIKVTRLSCSAPTATYTIVPNCITNQFSVDISVSSLGSATSIAITEGATSIGTLTAPGVVTAGPYAAGTSHTYLLTHDVDALCNVTSPAQSFAMCGDDLCNAIVLTAGGPADCKNTTTATTSPTDPGVNGCSAANNTIWYTFTPTVSGVYPINMTTPPTGDALSSWIVMYEVTGGCTTPTFTNVPFSLACLPGTNGTNNYTNTFNTAPLTSGTTYYILVDGNSGDVGSYCISVLPVITCNAPTGLTAGATTTTDATFTWTASSSNPGLGYEYYHNTSSTAPTGTTPATGSVGGGVTTATIPGLTPATTYNIWVRAVCSATDASLWVGPIAMTTACLPVTTFPWTEGFEGLTTVGTTSFPVCWKKENGDWATAIGNTYNTPFAGTNYLRNSWSATNEYMWTPGFDLVMGTSYDFSFMVQGDGWTGWVVDVLHNSSPISTGATQVGTSYSVPGTGSIALQPYNKQTYTFVPTTSGVYYFAIRVNQPSGSPWYVAFDNFKMELTPSCTEPLALNGTSTATDVTVNWTASASNPAFGYEYYYDVVSTSPTSTTVPSGTVGVGATTTTISGLTPQTTYYIWVRSVCTPIDQSPWAGPFTIMTQCAPIVTLPWTENFDALTTLGLTSFPPCWVKENGTWETSNATTYNTPRSGANYLRLNWNATNEYIWTPAFDLQSGTSYDLSFYVQGDGYSTWVVDIFQNGTATSSGATQIGTPYNVPGVGSQVMQPYIKRTYTFVPTVSGVYHFGIRVNEPTTSPWYLAFDDFSLSITPTCVEPATVTAGTNTTTDINFSWAASTSNPGLGYEYYHSLTNTAPTASTTATGTVSAGITNATISGLNPGTPYYVWVRANCGGNDFSAWAGPLTTFTQLTNDEASGAIPLTVNPNYDCGAVTTGTTAGATASADAAPSCNATGTNDDVWYSFTATNTAHRVTLYGVTSVSNIALYSGALGSLTEVTGACATNNSTTTAANIYATGLTVNSVYYVRVYTQTATAATNSAFTICVGTAPTSAPANDLCPNAVNIGNSQPMIGSNGGATQDVAACNAAAVANDVWYTFTTGSVAGNVTVTGITTYADIVMEAFTGTCGNLTAVSTCIDVPAIGTETMTIAALANTTYYVRVFGFNPGTLDQGTFTIQALGTPLSVKLSDISATNVGKRNRVDWITASETAGDRFELERSADGRNFSQLSTINARGEASTYSYWDEKPVAGVNYYRLKMVDAAGSFTYSDVVTAKVAGTGAFTIEAYPNPVSEMLTVKVYGAAGNNPTVSVSDITGKVVKVVTVTNNEATINMSGLAQGMYLVKYTDNNNTETIKVNKK